MSCLVFVQVFEKALDEPKYSSMYAQLCLRLSQEAPNFDDPGKTGNSVNSWIVCYQLWIIRWTALASVIKHQVLI